MSVSLVKIQLCVFIISVITTTSLLLIQKQTGNEKKKKNCSFFTIIHALFEIEFYLERLVIIVSSAFVEETVKSRDLERGGGGGENGVSHGLCIAGPGRRPGSFWVE